MDKEEMVQKEVMENGKEGEVQVDPRMQKDADAYTTGLMKMLHSRETSPKVLEMLKGGPPEEVVPRTALLVNQQMEEGIKQKQGKPPSLETLLSAGVYLSQDLIDIGNAAGIFQVQEQDAPPILQSTMQQYIEKGLKDGSIDPIELQTLVEPLMDEEQTAMGMEAGSASGIPAAPDTMTAMEQYAVKREKKAGMLQGGK